ncbi:MULTISPECIES: alpha/beta fold hydrolase [Staphylococcus]|uniref:Lysophospholipase n=2 Tax=Staphylococcus haemolyticus TaxID=1283 RepID=A0A2K0A8F8_STAHA|nr:MULTISPECIES: alpha/beta fold hydrolase [Staphylococcus]KGF26292.1 lysophospholipase [Staphylococcus haemolyticus DNF00585]MCH4444070.1 lysophospholipase [Staphylococcus haemolyticus]OFL89606.1 lysophospholipase [Staphylococcus sp. HMSC069D12]PNN21283.1 lysophospholipase [Staphylococcus haemolyticus]QUX19198.1 alpha/beta hydrolase [Staphylococcus haemolyticus]
MSQQSFKITVEDGTMIEVKVDKAKIATFGVVHIFHGMAEHMDRYEALVQALTHQGYDVIRHNHRGHGIDIDENERGHYDDMNIIAQDAYEIAQTLHGSDNNIPYIVLGHSMGSIIARLFVEKYPDIAQGLILTGTGQYPKYKGIPAIIVLKLITLIFGKRSCLEWVNQFVYKSFNKKIDQPETSSDWLSSKRDEINKFVKDDYTGFLVSNQLIYQTVKNMIRTANNNQLKKINEVLPILLISGKDDPFGDYGKGIRKLGKKFKRAGINHITVQLYANRRHEILFEDEKEMIWSHMFEWIQKQVLKKK